MDTKRFGRILRAARKASGLSQHVAAERAGLRQAMISQYESGVRKPELANLVKLAEVYGVELRLGDQAITRAS